MGGRGAKSKRPSGSGSGGKDPMQEVTDQNTALRRDEAVALAARQKADTLASQASKQSVATARTLAAMAGDNANAATDAARSARARADRIQKLADSLRSHPDQFFRDSSAAQAASALKHAQRAELTAKGARKSARSAYRAAKLPVPDALKGD